MFIIKTQSGRLVNNADLISRSELQSEIAKGVGECRIRAFEPSVNCILQIIHRMSAADVQPVKRGKWIWDSNAPYREHGAYKCSNCGCHSDFEENYCYNCGTRMDGDAE